ncbi:tripartite tricarboxylate transporter substrate binding protein [Aurantimonas aggregata]|uniref:Tripartite tricarboxylate transporter substrate binding protein n=1 Tax=Aurantimonas aggregata TaxID=2047720 RepID=A0A6L9MMN5_9HYPH|nr:tripartite tricarboxylate transporter substrate binding protein [Aurantimonas aggregata]NDV89083.1 tripartite tricarboxylate transporter substrate binding protein [Aurantimonas aggregata]
MNVSKRLMLLATAAGVALMGGAASAEDYPSRPITLIVPYPAGGGTDIVARTLAAELEKELGVTINVTNRAGGGGIVGTTAISQARPDGYTIGVIASDISLYKPQGLADLSLENLTPIGQTNELPGGITVKADAPYANIAELIGAIEANPGTLKATGAPPNANWHVGYLGFTLAADVDPQNVIWVPTQGGAAGHLDVAAGNSTFSTASLVEAKALIEAGQLRPLAISADERSSAFPEIPTLKESGIEWSYGLWHGVVGPQDLPDEERRVLLAAVENAANSEGFRNTLVDRGFTHVWRGGDDFRAFMASDMEAMAEIFSRLKK